MPFEIKWEEDGFLSRFWGNVLEKEIELKNRKFSSDTRCESSRYRIFDGTQIETFDFSIDGIAKMASNDIGMGFYLEKLKIVLIGKKPEVLDVYRKYSETCRQSGLNWEFHICSSLQQAREWLGQAQIEKEKESSNCS